MHYRQRAPTPVRGMQRDFSPVGARAGAGDYRRRRSLRGRLDNRRAAKTRLQSHFYTSGQYASQFEQLGDMGLTVMKLDGEAGQASGIKMCYAALTKGTSALYSQLLIAAELMGLTEPLLAEFESGQQAVLQRMERGIPTVPPGHADGSAKWRRSGTLSSS